MEGIHFELKRVAKERNEELDASKLLGAPVFPEGFFDSLPLEEGDYFVAQINCEQAKAKKPFPDKGWLYIFLNVDTLKPKVFYTDQEPGEVIDEINGSFDPADFGDTTCLKMVFTEDDGHNAIFGDLDYDIGLEGDTEPRGKKTLLQIDAITVPQQEKRPLTFGNFGFLDGYWSFLIPEEDLKNLRFDRVEFIEIE